MNKRVLYILLFFFFQLSLKTFASSFLGGEITWECQGNGNYRFILKLYRKCNAANFNHVDTIFTTHPTVTHIIVSNVSKTDLSPVCNVAGPGVQCSPAPLTPNTGAVRMGLYFRFSLSKWSNFNRSSAGAGWIFSNHECCRNSCTNITNATNYGWYLRAIMYPYNGQNEGPCFDSSPTFAENPPTAICTGYPYTYNYNAWDKIYSLAFEWAPPLDTTGLPLTPNYAAGYSFTNPMPDASFNPNNVPATVNPYTGEISFTSFTQGEFMTVVKVTAYKCHIKVGKVFREMQVVLLACSVILLLKLQRLFLMVWVIIKL